MCVSVPPGDDHRTVSPPVCSGAENDPVGITSTTRFRRKSDRPPCPWHNIDESAPARPAAHDCGEFLAVGEDNFTTTRGEINGPSLGGIPCPPTRTAPTAQYKLTQQPLRPQPATYSTANDA